MEKSKHTPGKWEIKELGGDEKAYTVYSDKSDKNHIAEVNRLHHFGAHQNLYDAESAIETKANANLIASAPRMLASLKLAVKHASLVRGYANIKPDSLQEGCLNELINNCNAIINKAEGK